MPANFISCENNTHLFRHSYTDKEVFIRKCFTETHDWISFLSTSNKNSHVSFPFYTSRAFNLFCKYLFFSFFSFSIIVCNCRLTVVLAVQCYLYLKRGVNMQLKCSLQQYSHPISCLYLTCKCLGTSFTSPTRYKNTGLCSWIIMWLGSKGRGYRFLTKSHYENMNVVQK